MPQTATVGPGGEHITAQRAPSGEEDDLYARLEAIDKTSKLGDGQQGGGDAQGGSHMIQWPPTPLAGPYGNWADVREGFSHRFQTKMPVEMKDLYGEQGFDQNIAKYEIASLQLQNLETLELLDRKEREMSALNLEISDFRGQMRTSLLVQDELFKQYFDEKNKYEAKVSILTKDNHDLQDRNAELEHNMKLMDGLVK
jgi:hypothetical protein